MLHVLVHRVVRRQCSLDRHELLSRIALECDPEDHPGNETDGDDRQCAANGLLGLA